MNTDSNDPLDCLYREIQKLPFEMRPPLLRHLNAAKKVQERRKRIIDLVNEALAELRLDMKYLLFDLHCTRKERDEANE